MGKLGILCGDERSNKRRENTLFRFFSVIAHRGQAHRDNDKVIRKFLNMTQSLNLSDWVLCLYKIKRDHVALNLLQSTSKLGAIQ